MSQPEFLRMLAAEKRPQVEQWLSDGKLQNIENFLKSEPARIREAFTRWKHGRLSVSNADQLPAQPIPRPRTNLWTTSPSYSTQSGLNQKRSNPATPPLYTQNPPAQSHRSPTAPKPQVAGRPPVAHIPPTPVYSLTSPPPALTFFGRPKDCDNITGLIIGTDGFNHKTYKAKYNVNVIVRKNYENPNHSKVTINGPEASFKDVHTVCMEVWMSIVSTPQCCKSTFVTPQKTFVATEDSLGKCLKKATNILLLGPSGVGKSTFLNAFANYLQFGANFQKAETNLRVCIRADYTLGDTPITLLPTDGPDDNNESQGNGVSKTQEARCYTFLYNTGTETKEIRVIDTPGLLDTEGPVKDQLNIARILQCAKQFPEIHAILFLLKPNEARLSPSLVFVLTELLKRLHHDAARNILFCFPLSYKNNPSCDTIPTVRKFLKDINDKHGVNIEMRNDSTLFHLDNFGFMYLGAKKFCNFVGNGPERQMAQERWKMSAEAIECLLRTIAKLPAYNIQKTMEIHDTNNWLQAFSFQMADLSKQVISNQQTLVEKKEEIRRLLRENKSLKGHLTHTQTHLVKIPLAASRIYCNSKKCSDVYGPPKIYEYDCDCYEGTDETGKELLNCKIFDKLGSMCKRCGCPVGTHHRLNYEIVQTTREVINDDFQNAANANLTEQQRAEKACQDLTIVTRKTESTLERLRKNGAIFAAYVQQNSLLPENDSFEKYLKICLQVAKSTSDNVSCTKLEEFMERYNQEKSIYEIGKMTGRGIVTIKEVHEKMDELEHDELISNEVKKCREVLGMDEDSVSEEVRLEITALFGQISTN